MFNIIRFTGQCKTFLVKVGSIVFSDYRLIERFTNECSDDITKFNCGRLADDDEVLSIVIQL